MLKDLQNVHYFLFTQHSLVTFDNCPLKFKKRYMENLKWDSFPEEATKKRLEMGNDFHLLALRYFLGIDSVLDEEKEEYDELINWIKNLEDKFPRREGVEYLPEYKLRMNSPSLKLEANFDLLLIKDGRVQIWDWKTHSESTKRGKPSSKRLMNSMQTIVYLFMLKEQSHLVFGEALHTVDISMHYWQPAPPEIVAEIRYTEEMHENFRALLETKIRNIYAYDYSLFDKELFKSHCKFCEFNWFCNNEKVDFKAMEELDEGLDGLDWDEIEEKW